MTTLPQIDWNRIVGQRRAYFGSPLDNMQRLGDAAGDIAGFIVQGQPVVLINTPALVREVLVTRTEEFPIAAPSAAALVGPVPMGQSDGAVHRGRRRQVMPAFKSRHFAAYAEIMADCTEHLQSGWRDGQIVPIARDMERLAFHVIARALLGLDDIDEGTPLGEAQRTMARAGFFKWSPAQQLTPWQARARRQQTQAHASLVDAVHSLVQSRRASGLDGGDMISILLRAQAEAKDVLETKENPADDEFVMQILGVVYAGTISFADSLVWTLYRLASQPDCAAAVQAEAQEAGRSASPGSGSLPELSYTLQVYRETLRDVPRFATFQRWATEQTTLGGFLVPRGARLCAFSYLLHHDPRLFPEPHRFNPGRFAPGWEERLPRHAYLPFGEGVHSCIGSHFALMEAQIVLAALLRRWRFEIAPRQATGEKLRQQIRPRHEFYLRVHKV